MSVTGIGADSELVKLLTGLVDEAGLELVDVVLRRSGRTQMLRLDVDRPGARGVDLDDCQRLSRAVGHALDDSELVSSSYRLEVSSPGTDRPIRSADDIRRNTGRPIVIETEDPEQGSRSIHGVLRGSSEGFLLVEDPQGTEVRIPERLVRRARQDVTI